MPAYELTHLTGDPDKPKAETRIIVGQDADYSEAEDALEGLLDFFRVDWPIERISSFRAYAVNPEPEDHEYEAWYCEDTSVFIGCGFNCESEEWHREDLEKLSEIMESSLDLRQLCDGLQQWEEENRTSSRVVDYRDRSEFPKFGGDTVTGNDDCYSWDESSMLVHDGKSGGWSITARPTPSSTPD